MAIRKLERKKGTVYEVYWRNPIIGKRECRHFDKRAEANKFNDQVLFRLKYEPESFAKTEPVEDDSVSVPINSIIKRYLEEANLADSTRRDNFYHMKPIAPLLARATIDTFSRKELKTVENGLKKLGLRQNTINRKISIIRSALSWAEKEYIIDKNPIIGYICKRGKDRINLPPTPEEAKLIWQHSPNHVRRVILLGFNFGVRVGPSELFKIKWEDVDLIRKKILIHAALKNDNVQVREIDIRDDLIPMFILWMQEDSAKGMNHLIHWKGKPVKVKVTRAFKTACKAAGITRKIRPYDLRHAFATWAIEGGADLKGVSTIMGHADATMILKRYQHVTGKLQKEAVESVPSITGGDFTHTDCTHKNTQNTPFSVFNNKKVQ